MIVTLTGNLLWERTLTFATWSPGRTQRATAESFQVGGKGINVSKMLNRFGTPNQAFCFAGGATGAECTEWLRAQGFAFEAFPTSAGTRVGLVVRGEHPAGAPDGRETTFLGPDAAPDAAAVEACARSLRGLAADTTVVLCGSVPGWTTATLAPLRDALADRSRAEQLIVDTYGPPLADLVRTPARLVKINRDEFDGLCEPASRERPLSERLAEARSRWPVRAWIITDGAREVWFSDETTPPTRVIPPPVREVSATGSGDVFLASVLQAWVAERRPLAAAVEFALPYGAANAAHPGVAEFDMNKLPKTLSERG